MTRIASMNESRSRAQYVAGARGHTAGPGAWRRFPGHVVNDAWMEIGPPGAPDANAPVAVKVRAVPPRRCRELFSYDSYEIESGSENDGGGWSAGRSDGDGCGLDMTQPADRNDPAGFDRRREDDR